MIRTPSLRLPDPPLGDDVVVLRPPTDADVAALYDACQDPDIQRFTFVPAPYEEEHARGWVAGSAQAREEGRALDFAVAAAGDPAALLGTIGVLRPDWDHAVAELGYWVAPWARGRGVAARALTLLAAWAVGELGFARLTLHIDADNAGSRRVAEQAGFAYEGTLRSAIAAKGRRWDIALYARLAGDPAP
jgi:RimJ/RimL family protein N-acetyltransferase